MNIDQVKETMAAEVDALHAKLVAAHGKPFAHFVRAQAGAKQKCDIFAGKLHALGAPEEIIDFIGNNMADILVAMSSTMASGIDIDDTKYNDVVQARNEYDAIYGKAVAQYNEPEIALTH